MDNSTEIFVSYSSRDAEIASELVSRLHDVGLRCFVAERDITASQQWQPALRDEIKKAKAVLILLTPRSLKSNWVAIETGAAWVLEKAIIPVTMFIEASDLSEPIRSFQLRPIETNAQTTTLVQEIQNLLRPEVESLGQSLAATSFEQGEAFEYIDTWARLQKIGSWHMDALSKVIHGEGQHHYLLSHAVYGNEPFKINCRLRFLPIQPNDPWTRLNAGIVFGWKSTGDVRRYYHLMFTGAKLQLELIGEKGGTVFQDFQHLDDGVTFPLKHGEWIDLEVTVAKSKLVAKIGTELVYSCFFGAEPVGRVGLRPWRTRIESDRFNISNLGPTL